MLQQPTTSTTKGLQVLTFENSTLTTSIDHTFTSSGPLRVIYFPSQVRFMLNVNDWNYALTKRLPVTASSSTDENSRHYILPGPKGTFTLKLSKLPSQAAIHNFDTIMNYCTSLSYKDEGSHDLHNTSIDYKIMDHSNTIFDDHIEETTDVRLDVHDLMDNCEEEANKENTVSKTELNTNMTKTKNIEEIKTTPENQVQVFELSTNQVMGAIERSREIEEKLSESMAPSLAFTSDRATADTLTMTLEKLMDDHSAILSSPEASKGNKSVSMILALSGLAARTEDDLLSEIQSERKIQEEARRLQEEARTQELDSIMKERKARDELMTEAMFEDYDVLEISKSERVLIEQINDTKEKLSMYEEELMTERSESKMRERELNKELERLNNKLAQKDSLTTEQRAAFMAKEKALKDLIEGCVSYTNDIDAKCNELMLLRQVREMELKERLEDLKMMAEEKKQDLKSEEGIWPIREQEEKDELRFKEKDLKVERRAYNRMKNMMEKEIKYVENAKKNLENQIRKTEEMVVKGWEDITYKKIQNEKLIEEITMQEQELGLIAMKVETGLIELQEVNNMTALKKKELQIKQNVLVGEFAEIIAEEELFLQKIQEFNAIAESKEKTIEARQTLFKDRQAEVLNEIRDIERECQRLKDNLEAEFQVIEGYMIEREVNLLETRIANEAGKARMELHMQESEALMEKTLESIRLKENLKQQKILEIQYEEEYRMRMAETYLQRKRLELEMIRIQQLDLLKLSEEIVKDHEAVLYEIEKAQWEVSQPMEFQKELELYFAKAEMGDCMQGSP